MLDATCNDLIVGGFTPTPEMLQGILEGFLPGSSQRYKISNHGENASLKLRKKCFVGIAPSWQITGGSGGT
jgi:hypothetical protein